MRKMMFGKVGCGPQRRFSRALLLGSALTMLASAASAAPSTNATVNLIRLLIEQKVITAQAGKALLAQAEAEAASARAAAPAAGVAAGAVAGAAVQSAEAPPLPPPAPGSIRVPYIPESVRAAMTAEIKEDVMAQAEFEGWARPSQIPAWTKGITLYGDLRMRSQSDLYSGNNTNELIDFQAFNDQSPLDINANTNPTGFPLLNTREDRTRLRIRARLGLLANINNQLSAGFRIASGDDNSPISTNQVLGGGFAKKDLWLDQAWLKITPTAWTNVTLGRFANPFVTTELTYDEDVNFDGGVAQFDGARWLPEEASAGLALGAFPFGYGSANFPSTAPDKSGDKAKWLFAGQIKGGWTFDESIALSGAVGYFRYSGIQGDLSEPCALYNGNRQCSTDQRRPTFLRKGNTLFLQRDILPDPANPLNYAQPQVLGLSFDYQLLDVSAEVKVPITDTIIVSVAGNYINNLGFKRGDICRFNPKGLPVNNITLAAPVAGADPATPAGQFYSNPCVADANGRIATFDGGNQGYNIRALVGYAKPRKKGEWNVELAYRYIESDATLDSLPDSEFHLGGSNAKGYLLGGRYGLYNGLVVGARWLSANAVSGPPLAIDVLQIDFVASF